MNRPPSLLLFAALLEMGAAPPAPNAPAPAAAPPAMRIAGFHAGSVRCGAFEAVPIRFVAPLPTAAAVAEPGAPIRFRFRIDQEGRPLGIRRVSPADPALDIRDLEPALTAWRFETGADRPECEIAFTVTLDDVDSADERLLYRYAALGRMQMPDRNGRALVDRAFARLRPPGSTCVSDPVSSAPIALDFRSIPEITGGMSYSFYSYDVDAGGRPVHIRLLDSSGNRALDVAGDVAIGRARFPAQPRTGCLHYFFRFSTETQPPPPLPPVDLRPAGAACAAGIPRQVGALVRMQFPVEFMRRRAEGRVVFGYDVSATGKLRNVRIIASEPAARFGDEVARAAAAVRLGDVPGPQLRCVQRVRFRLPER